jgi:hypothetical protein
MRRFKRRQKMLRLTVLPALLLSALLPALRERASAQDAPLIIKPVKIYDEPAKPLLDDKDHVSTNISGIGCLPPKEATRHCLMIDDEGQRAQIVRLGEDGLTVTDHRPRLIREDADPPPFGAAPMNADCSAGNGKFKDLDGEAVAYANSYFYVAGSHGCSRNSFKFHPSAFLLVRLPVDETGHMAGEPQATYRLSEALKGSEKVKNYFGKDLTSANGLNIEGLAVSDDWIYAGLRAPSLEKEAFIVRASASALFSDSPLPDTTETWPVKLGENIGIRDLATLEDGRFVILAGAAQEQESLPFSLFLTEGGFRSAARPVAILESVETKTTKKKPAKPAKAEAIQVLGLDGGILRVAIFFDGLKSGGGREYVVKIP